MTPEEFSANIEALKKFWINVCSVNEQLNESVSPGIGTKVTEIMLQTVWDTVQETHKQNVTAFKDLAEHIAKGKDIASFTPKGT